MSFSELAIALVAKFPFPGKVKTRLIPAFSPEQAAAAHRCFLQHLVKRLTRLNPVELIVYFDPPDAFTQFRELLPDVDPQFLIPQCGGDLGHRLAHLCRVVARRRTQILILGADSPDVPDDHLLAAARLTRAAQVSISPTDDGGYWCIGFSSEVDFDRLLHDGIDWSTAHTAEQTLAKARSIGYTTARGNAWDDIDRPEDLHRLLARLAKSNNADDRLLRRRLQAALLH